MQDFLYFNGTQSGSLERLSGETGEQFNSYACNNADTFFFIYNTCNESLTLTYEVRAAQYTPAACPVFGTCVVATGRVQTLPHYAVGNSGSPNRADPRQGRRMSWCSWLRKNLCMFRNTDNTIFKRCLTLNFQ